MAEERKGITVKIDANLHAEIRQFIEQNGMTMAEFVSQALYNELHPKIQPQEVKNMAPTRTMAFQMPEDMFQRLKDYLHRHNMTQKEFVLGLVEAEIKRDEELISSQSTKTNEHLDSEQDSPTEIIKNEGINNEIDDNEYPDAKQNVSDTAAENAMSDNNEYAEEFEDESFSIAM